MKNSFFTLRISARRIVGLVVIFVIFGMILYQTQYPDRIMDTFDNQMNTKKNDLVQVTETPRDSLFKEAEAISHITFDTVEKENTVYTVLILISSFITHRNRRIKIRETWGNSSMWATADKYKIVFLTGKVNTASSMIEIAEEAKISKDIVLLDIPENFYLLAKKVIVGLTWAKHNIKFKSVLKGDDDTFMNIDNIIDFINQNKKTDGYFGNLMYHQPVERKGRYKLTKEEHKNDYFAPYCSGGGYILTNSTVYKIVPYFDLEKNLKIDDAYIGEVAFDAGINATHTSGFYMWNTWCEYVKNIKVSHPANDPECNQFLLLRSMIDNGKNPRDLVLEKQKYFKNMSHFITTSKNQTN
ncbi:N-acetyllactosaminide beta-1,3-N-acetylglucosaminyltransferase 4 isoform X1 [Hydra vulgaris]|uniref:N-acetyllactosaminide beta-1,3-N-acetylglucosaminyltransferase 4 isoform X1 n=1 Tax=Hydra vulgaris TaxID=6087 RepID=UPI001F5F905F|nr:N-acetyllactosaminide beta-1,3-N-acetylglucosaminyltransferase 4-like [Hydra vulgaris]